MLLATVWLAFNLIESPRGRALRALHGSEVAAQTLGIDSGRAKLQVFVLSALVAALAGALMAHYTGFITPAKASFLHSVELVIMVVFGGMASVFGAVVGAAVLTMLPQLLTVLKDYEMMVFGAVLIATMVFFPQGVVPTLAHWWGAEAAMTLLAVQGLGKAFGGVHANQDVNLAVRAGTVHSIIGPNGAGKTSLINMLSGVYRPDAGSIRLDGVELAGLPTHRFAAAGIGRTFQNLQVFFNMTALENVMTGRHLREPASLLGVAAAPARAWCVPRPPAATPRGGCCARWAWRHGKTRPPTPCPTAR